jgi:hypothetical protein
MGRAIIVQGVWTRTVTWQHGGEWRTDMFKSTLSDIRLLFAKFVLKGGPTVIIPAEELRRVIVGGPDHYAGKIWGPFNICPKTTTVNREKVRMNVLN